MIEGPFEGGCLCNAILYRVTGPALQTSYCHCEDCRKASGAPAVAWTFFKTGTLQWRLGKPKILNFAGRERSFCRGCGTPLMFFDPELPEFFEINTCTFDDPTPHVPNDQCWVHDEIPWASQLADLPRYEFTSPLPPS
ncbi:MAG: GFA family protein [Luteolibacter sp.]